VFSSEWNEGIRQIAKAPVGPHMPPCPKRSVIQPKSHLLNKAVISAKMIFSFLGKNQNNSRVGKILEKLEKRGGGE